MAVCRSGCAWCSTRRSRVMGDPPAPSPSCVRFQDAQVRASVFPKCWVCLPQPSEKVSGVSPSCKLFPEARQAFPRRWMVRVAGRWRRGCRSKVSGKQSLEKKLTSSPALLDRGSSDLRKFVPAHVFFSPNSWRFRCSFLGVL